MKHLQSVFYKPSSELGAAFLTWKTHTCSNPESDEKSNLKAPRGQEEAQILPTIGLIEANTVNEWVYICIGGWVGE